METLDQINDALAFGEYMAEIDSIVYAERNEYIVRYHKAESEVENQRQINKAKTEIMESLLKGNVLKEDEISELKQKLRRARWRAWRDRILLTLGIVAAIVFE